MKKRIKIVIEKYKVVNVAEATKLASEKVKSFGVSLSDLNNELEKMQFDAKQKIHHQN